MNTLSAITIPAGVTTIQANIEILDDTIVENNEVFTISLSYPGYVDGGDNVEVTVTIMDSDSKCVNHTSSIIVIH